MSENEGLLKQRIRERAYADQTNIVEVSDVEQILDEAKRSFPYYENYVDTPDDEDYFNAVKKWFLEQFGSGVDSKEAEKK